MRRGTVQVLGEVPVHAALEHLREREDFDERDRRADEARVAGLVGLAHRSDLAADGDDRLGPELSVHHLLGAVAREVEHELRATRAARDLAEDETSMQLRGAIEVQEVELSRRDVHGTLRDRS